MVSFVVWGHVAGVRFPPPRPVVLAFIDGVEKDKLSIKKFRADGIIGNTVALQVTVGGSIPPRSTNKVM